MSEPPLSEPARDYCPLWGKVHRLALDFANCEDCGMVHPSCPCGFVDYTRSEKGEGA